MAEGKEVPRMNFIMERNSELFDLGNVSGRSVLDTLSEFRYITKLGRVVSNSLKNGGRTLSIIYIIYLIQFSSYFSSLSFLLKLQISHGGMAWQK